MGKNAERYEIRWEDTEAQLPYVVLVGGNGEELFKTEAVSHLQAANDSIRAIRRCSQTQRIDVLTKPKKKA